MSIRFAICIVTLAVSSVALAQDATVNANSPGTTSGASATGDTSGGGTGDTFRARELGTLTSEIETGTVESSRTTGLSNLSGNTLQNTSGAGNTQLPGGSNFRNNNARRANTGRGQTGRSTSTRSIRPSLRLGFTPNLRPATDVGRSVGRSFSRIASRTSRIAETNPRLRGVTLVPGKGGLLTLRGTVPSASAKRLAENILRMEPGVRKIQNELKVAQAIPTSNTTSGN